jgi:antitoxin component YwqK of YwqJK toxin-antitoxin module
MKLIRLLVFINIFFTPAVLFAQDKEENDQDADQRFTIDKPVNLNFEEEKPEEPKKKKKVKKKVFYGLKTKKGFTRSGYGAKVTYELFYYLKKPQMPTSFVRDIWWYDFTRKQIRNTEKFDASKGVLLHGPYEQRQGNVILKKGIFYKGTKHGRWLTYNKDSVLTDKEKYFRGWPKESEVSYYDPMERKKMKELIPIEFGERNGYYYRFYENGQVAVMGEYRWDVKVGDWTEYYPNNKRKKILSYPKEPFEKEFLPYVKAEWNDKGKEVYRNNKLARN